MRKSRSECKMDHRQWKNEEMEDLAAGEEEEAEEEEVVEEGSGEDVDIEGVAEGVVGAEAEVVGIN